MNHWFKFWTSAREDAKLRSLTDTEFRYWVLLLCVAAEDCGSVDLSDPEWVCVDAGLMDENNEPAVDALMAIVDKLERRRLVIRDGDTITFAGWERRQMKPSDRPDAIRERVAKHRESKRNTDVTRYVTPTEDRRQKTERDKGSAREALDNFPECMTTDSWKPPDGEFDTSKGQVLRAIEARHSRIPSKEDLGLIGAAIRSRCPSGCKQDEPEKCAMFAISKINKAARVVTAAKWIGED